MKITWNDIEKSLVTLEKVGIDNDTKKWAWQEVVAYQFLARHNYTSIPEIVAYNDEKTAFALEVLAQEDGWDWSDTWTEARLSQS